MAKKMLMVICFVLVSCSVCASSTTVAKQIKWYSYDEGLALSQKEGKKVFLHFYADWCHFCKEMKKRTFLNDNVIDYLNENFISILIDTDKEGKLTATYFVRGLPATFFLTPDGTKINVPIEENKSMSNIPGFISEEVFLKLIRFVHDGSYNSMNFKHYIEKDAPGEDTPKHR